MLEQRQLLQEGPSKAEGSHSFVVLSRSYIVQYQIQFNSSQFTPCDYHGQLWAEISADRVAGRRKEKGHAFADCPVATGVSPKEQGQLN